jgi:hypothetical protein
VSAQERLRRQQQIPSITAILRAIVQGIAVGPLATAAAIEFSY